MGIGGRRWTRTCAVLALGFAAIALWSWGAGVADILTFSSRHIPMAPSTALLVLLLSLAVFISERWPGHAAVVRFARGSASFAAVAGLLAAVRAALGWDSPLEIWLARTVERVDGIPLGLMSPLTGAAILAASLVLLLHHGRREPSLHARWIATVLAAAVTLTGLVMAASYAVDAPLFYGDGLIPMALWTSATFVFLGLSQLALVRTPRSVQPGGAGAVPVLVAGLLALVGGTIGAVYLRYEQDIRRSEARGLLHAIADLKVEQIGTWRSERLGDARFFARASFFAADVQAFMAAPSSMPARDALMHWLTLLKAGDRYRAVVLFDPSANPVLSAVTPGSALPPIDPALLAAAAGTNRVMIIDLHLISMDGEARMELLFPVFAPGASHPAADPSPDGFPAAAGRPLLGVVRMCIDPGAYLYPMIRSWPTPSLTAETMLGRREGDEVVALNEMRHRTNGLFARFPITPGSRLPAARAALGHSGFLDGIDYRGEPVLADVRPVPGSPWFVIAKVDRSEIYAPLREQAWLTLLNTLLLALLIGVLVGYVWRSRESSFTRRELAAERQRTALAERIEHLMKGANDIILLADEEERILDANDRAVEAYGYSREELRTMRVPDLRDDASRPGFERDTVAILSRGRARFETVNRRKNGTTFPVEVSASLIEIGGVRYRMGIVLDITERKAREREIEQLNGLFATLSDVNQALVRARSRGEIFDATCRIVAKHAGFRAVWIGCVDPSSRTLVPSSIAGDASDYVALVHINLDEVSERRGPALLCLLEGRPCVVNDFLSDPRMAAKRARAVEHGIRSAAALPLRFQGAICGVLMVYSGEPGVFRERETALLEEIAMDISFGLDHLDQEAKRRAAETALRCHADELRQRNEELERFNRASVGRELRMVELKREINRLHREAGRPEPHLLDFGDDEKPIQRSDPTGEP